MQILCAIFMKHQSTIILLCVFFVCSCKNKSGKNIIDDTRKKFSKDAEEFNEVTLRKIQFEDSLYNLASINLDSGIHAIDKFINAAPTYSPYFKIKGDFYFRYKKYLQAKEEYSKALNFEKYPNATIFRASCYLNLKQYDSCLMDLNSFPEYNHSCYWYIGNYYEARGNLDSATYYYAKLFREDTIVYKYCKERTDYLLNNSHPKMFTELSLRDTSRVVIYLH